MLVWDDSSRLAAAEPVPCEFCGRVTPAVSGPCLRCWTPLPIGEFTFLLTGAVAGTGLALPGVRRRRR